MELTYAAMVKALAKPGADICATLTPAKAHMWHMASALQGEAGEAFDAVKRLVIYNKELDEANLIEELGDIEFYLEGLRQSIGISREDVLSTNIVKLKKRYTPLQYSDQAAQLRADKA